MWAIGAGRWLRGFLVAIGTKGSRMARRRIEDLPPHSRRGFFSASLSRLLRPLADALEERLPVALPMVRMHLRPPGAIEERAFLETCYRCGSCVDSCPADAIIQKKGGEEDETNGTPVIAANVRACVVCDELACMKACPSGALKEVGKYAIRVGLAVVNHDLCVRAKGEDCRECIDRCPLGETALKLWSNGRVNVIDPESTGRGCVGCGLCQQYCPVEPLKAIQVKPL